MCKCRRSWTGAQGGARTQDIQEKGKKEERQFETTEEDEGDA